MNSTIYNDEILDFLKTSSAWYEFNSTEFVTFCPFCGDEHRKGRGITPTHGHLYISIVKESGPTFYCQRCKTDGHINKLLSFLGFKGEIPKDILQFQSETRKKKLNGLRIDSGVKVKLNNERWQLFQYKVDYLIGRHVINPTKDIKEQLDNLKIIIDVETFVNENFKLFQNGKISKMYNWLINSFVGFLSYENKCIEFRTIEYNPRMKYYRHKLVNDENCFQWAYRYKNGTLKYLNTRTITHTPIILSEGIIDLSVIQTKYRKKIESYLNVKLDDVVLIATGKNFYQGYDSIRRKIMNFQSTVIIFLDPDMGISRSLKNAFKYSTCSQTIYLRNKNGDFNVFPIEPTTTF